MINSKMSDYLIFLLKGLVYESAPLLFVLSLIIFSLMILLWLYFNRRIIEKHSIAQSSFTIEQITIVNTITSFFQFVLLDYSSTPQYVPPKLCLFFYRPLFLRCDDFCVKSPGQNLFRERTLSVLRVDSFLSGRSPEVFGSMRSCGSLEGTL